MTHEKVRDVYFGGSDPRNVPPWEYPDCLICGVEIYMKIGRCGKRFRCMKCGTRYYPEQDGGIVPCGDYEDRAFR